MSNKVTSLDAAVELVMDGSLLGGGGALLDRKPVAFLDAVTRADRRGLRYHSFLGSVDVEMLVVRGAVAEVHTGYVGFEQLGFAPRYLEAVTAGNVVLCEYTELLFVAGLRAAAAGLPFMPAKGGTGSALVEELGFHDIADPYGGETVIAVPAMRLDIAVIHADKADVRGNVSAPSAKTFLWDTDALVARAADRVVVTVEEVVPDLRAEPGCTVLLYGYEVDAVVEAPGGARPTSMAGRYQADLSAIRKYVAAASQGSAGSAIDALVS